MAELSDELLQQLIVAARRASERAYAPYSRFAVGAAILSADGKIYSGCNVENASYGLACCAERNAIFQMVGDGQQQIVCVAVYTNTDRPTAPCGACRQVINEFGPRARIVSTCRNPDRLDTNLNNLFPDAFGPHSL